MSAWEAVGKSEEWYTPKYIFDALGCMFDMDVAGSPGAGHVPCHHTIAAESLSLTWHGFVWMNPPYGGRNGLVPWLSKFFWHGAGIALVPDRTSAPWFQEYIRRADAVMFVSPKIKFERPDGSPGKHPGTGSALLAAGSRGERALIQAKSLGLLMQNHWSGRNDDAHQEGLVRRRSGRCSARGDTPREVLRNPGG